MDSLRLAPGLSATRRRIVEAGDTAAALGSGSLPVLATPRLLAWLESETCQAVAESLLDGTSSVGTRLTLEHLSPSPVGAPVVCAATLVHVDGRLLRFEVVATNSDGVPIGHGEVTRVVVDDARFLARAGASGD